MTKEKIERINYLYRKSKETELSPEEKSEQKALREEYLYEVRVSFGSMLDHTVIRYPDGTEKKVQKKK